MKILNLVQGSDPWLDARLNHLCASEAPVIMGESKFMTRNQLLDLKKGWKKNPDSSFKKRLFEKGHEHEDQAREILELETCEEFPPIVGLLEREDINSKLLASFDGLQNGCAGSMVWEHKSWNAVLAENVRNEILEPLYYWQLEHQLLVSHCDTALFTCSDGTQENKVSMYYASQPERREKLIEGWKLFLEDLENHELKAKQEIIVAREQEKFPLIKCEVEGSTVISNLGDFIPKIKAAIDERLSVVLETDQDFADTEAFVKNIKLARTTLKEKQTSVTNAFESYSAFVGDVKTTDVILQKAESTLTNAVKANKNAKKISIVNNANNQFTAHLAKLSEGINKVQITQVVVDFEAVMKGKRSFAKMEEAVNAELAKAKIEANEISQVIRKNLDSLTELAKDHKFLFSDHAMLLLKDNDDLINLIKARIAEHEEAEAKRKAEEKARIEAEAKENAEREAQAELDRKAQSIRDEERAKVEAEQKKEADRIAQIKANDAELQKRSSNDIVNNTHETAKILDSAGADGNDARIEPVNPKPSKFKQGHHYQLISCDGEESIVYFYLNPDANCLGFGFNIADGGGFLPESDLRSDSIVNELVITLK